MYQVHLSLPDLYKQCCADFEISTTLVCTTLVKIDVLDTYGAMMFILWNHIFSTFKKIENAVNRSFKYSILLFINGFIFDIMNIQNYQSLEFE